MRLCRPLCTLGLIALATSGALAETDVRSGAPSGPQTGAPVAPASSPAVRALSARLSAPSSGSPSDNLESQLAGLCGASNRPGDVAEAALVAGYDLFSVVRDTILACATSGTAVEVAAEVALRAQLLGGETGRYLIEGGVLSAASEIARRGQSPRVVSGGTDAAERALERERLERMMQKGLLDDAYREYIDRQRKKAAGMVTEPYTDSDYALYRILFAQGLFGAGFFDDFYEIGDDAGGSASQE